MIGKKVKFVVFDDVGYSHNTKTYKTKNDFTYGSTGEIMTIVNNEQYIVRDDSGYVMRRLKSNEIEIIE